MLLVPYLLLLYLSQEKAIQLTKEDGLIESLAPVFYFFAAILLLYVFAKSKSLQRPYILQTKRNIFYALLASYFIICAGEEISWGQRIFKIETPEILLKDNAQQEINIHNLWIFQGYDKNFHAKEGLQSWFTNARLYSFIWFLYCFIIPLIYTYSITAIKFLRKYYFPVVPLWIGVLFLMNHIISKSFESLDRFNQFKMNSPIVETKESNFAILFFIASISLHYLNKTSIKDIK